MAGRKTGIACSGYSVNPMDIVGSEKNYGPWVMNHVFEKLGNHTRNQKTYGHLYGPRDFFSDQHYSYKTDCKKAISQIRE